MVFLLDFSELAPRLQDGFGLAAAFRPLALNLRKESSKARVLAYFAGLSVALSVSAPSSEKYSDVCSSF